MTSRRDAIAALMGLPFAKNVSEITKDSRVLVLTLQEKFDPDNVVIDCDSIRTHVNETLKRAGFQDIEVIVLNGLDAKIIDKK